jgi:hypothetical protein
MNKLELAHDYAKIMLKISAESGDLFLTNTDEIVKSIVSSSFNFAEEMLAENEKREDKSRPEVLIYPEFDITVNYPDYAEVKFNGYIMKAGMAKILFNNMVKIK